MRRSDRPGAVLRAAASCAAAALAALASPAPASAYCRTSVCPGTGTASVCTPAQPTDCGIPLFWPSPCVSYSIQQDASKDVSLADTEAIFAAAFETWTTAACGAGGETPRMRVDYTGPVECTMHEYNQNKGNANVIVFRDAGWPYAGGGSTLALTTVTYNLDTGEIYDADMELNSASERFSTDDATVTFDLRSIATHETGHFLGLSHSADLGATMFSDYKPGTVSLRDLSDDDVTAICTVYPPGDPIDGCDSTPRHGYSPLAAADQPEGGDQEASGGCCSVAGPGTGRGGAWGLATIAVLGAALQRARGRRARARARRTPAVAPREADPARAS